MQHDRIRFATLGPAGSNHELVLARYLAFHGIAARTQIGLVADFAEAARSVLAGEADFILQCAVHPATPATVARFFQGLFVVDTFISPSRDLAVVRRRDRPVATSIGAMAATTAYVDLSRWGRLETTDTVSTVARGLLEGRFDAGLTFSTLVDQYPDRFCIDLAVPSVDDAWLVYGRERVSNGALVACAGGPAAKMFRSLATLPDRT